MGTRRRADSLTTYVAIVEEAADAASSDRWFRGVGSDTHLLIPGLYRPPTSLPAEDIFNAERRMFEQFKMRSRPFLAPEVWQDPWELLFVMQHHRMPTRLLDWTESPFVALYFALEAAERLRFQKPAVVWTLDPISWNDHTFRSPRRPPGAVFTAGEEKIDPYRPPTDTDRIYPSPVAIYAPHNNPRIVAQGGTFTIFGSDMTPMDLLRNQEGYPDGCLTEVEIPPESAKKMLDNLVKLGYTHSRVFPDLDGLAHELRRSSGYQT